MRLASLLVLSLIPLIACGNDDGTGRDASATPPDGQPIPDGGLPGPDAASPGPDAGLPGPDAALPTIALCQPACDVATDCDQGSAPFDADNYTCSPEGACAYRGCNDDDECQALGDTVCRQLAGSSLPLCLLACDVAADCDQGSAAYDADNYACVDGACVYQGCVGTAECQTLGDYVCATPPGSTMPVCVPPCDGPADCDQGSAPFDADNYACAGGACVYQGCNGDGECQALGDYVCAG